MRSPNRRQRFLVLILAAALVLGMSLSVSAAVAGADAPQPAAVAAFSKNGTVSDVITFSEADLRVTGDDKTAILDSIILSSLPDQQAGILMIGDQVLAAGDVLSVSAVNGMRFYPLSAPTVASTSFRFTPVFTTGASGEDVTVNLYLLTAENHAPIAENLEFSTYKNVAYTGQFAAIDPEGDLLTFQLVDKPARGSVSMPEEGSCEFVYTPYENKTGKDSFTYVAVDSLGNISAQATVKLKIEKPSTKVVYEDMDGHGAYNSAIKLAENGIFIGAVMDGAYYFQPDQPVSRSEFLALAMAAAGMESLEGVTITGFSDDSATPVWAKPYISSALRCGVIQGTVTQDGQVVFSGSDLITEAEAAVMLNRMLAITDAPVAAWSTTLTAVPAWASQAVINLETVGVLQTGSTGTRTLRSELTRADAAQLLAGALDVLEARESSGSWYNW